MIILGLASTPQGDASAALLVDQTLVAAADEAALTRTAPPQTRLPWAAAHYCLQQAGVRPEQVDTIALASAPGSLFDSLHWHYLARLWANAPLNALLAVIDSNRPYRRLLHEYKVLMQQLGVDAARTPLIAVQSALAHASAGFFLSGTIPNTLFISADESVDATAVVLGQTHNGQLKVHSRLPQPDNLFQVMRCMGAYLGFGTARAAEGIALLARHGDAMRYDLSKLFSCAGGVVRLNTELIDPSGRNAWQFAGKRYPFTQRLVDWLGPPAIEAPAYDPHAHYAAALYRLFEQTMQTQIKQLQLAMQLQSTPNLPCNELLLGGDAGQYRAFNQRLLQQGNIQHLHVAPANGATGAALGAAGWVAAQHGIKLDRVEHPYWGPSYMSEECIAACKRHPAQPAFEIVKDPAKKAARLLAEGHGVCWLQGRMETSAWPLGARALLYSPTSPKRPPHFTRNTNTWGANPLMALSVTATSLPRYTTDSSPAPFAHRYVELHDEARAWLPPDLHLNGAAPLHTPHKKHAPRLHALLDELEKLTGHGMVVQMPLQTAQMTSACSPTDALDAWVNNGSDYLVMEDVLVKRTL